MEKRHRVVFNLGYVVFHFPRFQAFLSSTPLWAFFECVAVFRDLPILPSVEEFPVLSQPWLSASQREEFFPLLLCNLGTVHFCFDRARPAPVARVATRLWTVRGENSLDFR